MPEGVIYMYLYEYEMDETNKISLTIQHNNNIIIFNISTYNCNSVILLHSYYNVEFSNNDSRS